MIVNILKELASVLFRVVSKNFVAHRSLLNAGVQLLPVDGQCLASYLIGW